ncbi:Ig heavy chain V region XIG14 [Takifugu flavidus]|uniref:Ig heavy chain V region XIG14 n=1 Tax=Takifugu flavidus TaxID=433684 RepID=A0A5C6MJH9_9TELE|nr:Ig heavy chain V region XIG14 [Takifugu flavidus]
MFSVALLLLLAAGSCVKGEQLTQPASVTVQPGQRLTITCQVSYSLSSYATHWIRQPAGKGLEWIGWKYTGDSDYKDSLKNKFSISLDSSSNTVTLNGVNVQPEDTAVYYCARDTITQTISGAEQKPLKASTQHHQRGRCHTRNES